MQGFLGAGIVIDNSIAVSPIRSAHGGAF